MSYMSQPKANITAPTRNRLLELGYELGSMVDRYPDDDVSRLAIKEAIDAGLEGNAGVGCVILDPGRKVLVSDHNRMLAPRFRSDLHAEMSALNIYEDSRQGGGDLRGHTLVTSLEPCEMCTIRIINSGVTTTLYVASDVGKGGITGPNTLAPHWASLAEPLTFAAADCSEEISGIALEVFSATIGGVVAKMKARR
ncbi:MAG: nucleoside deaminase [Acidimicrobiia bacterium]|nr:nucleoside deaminase [Acidimicrobiia bacterium]MYD04077.1 nucleoside deaminase [Acidimicrobiia bacterium]